MRLSVVSAPDSPHRNSTLEDESGKAARPVILQVLPRLVTGGVERGTVDVAAAIAEAGWLPIVASAGGPMVREVERAGAEHVELPLHSRNPFVIRANVGRLADLVRARGVDIVHARSRAPAWSAYAAARRTGASFLTTFHGDYRQSSWLKRRYNAVMARGERVIAISEFIAERAAAAHGVPQARIRVVPRGIDFEAFDPDSVSADRIAALAAAWRLADGAPVVMLPGRMTRLKGHHVFVDALARLGRHDLHCVFVGGDAGRRRYREELERVIARAGISEMTRFVGQCRDMPAAYMLADVVVSPSTSPEAFGRVPVEAQAMGRPVIATDHGGARETVLPGETGWLVPPDDADALAAALQEALAMSGEARVRLAARAAAHVRGRFTRERMCAATLDVYRELLAERAAGRPQQIGSTGQP